MRRLAGLLLALFCVIGPARAESLFGETSFTLKNGLQVVVVPNHRAPLVTQWLWYKVGAADEERGKSGAAHFLEHLMFKGTKTMKPKEFSALVAKQGGQENAFTSWDYTAFHQNIAASQLELVMKLESDRMHNLLFDDTELQHERSVVLEEWGMRIGNQPSALLDEQVETALYLNHPYRIPVLGWTDEIKTLGVPEEKRFYDTWYAPNNAVLIVAGDVTVEQVKALADKYYGPIPSRPVPARERLEEPDRVADTVVTLHHPRVRTPSWSRRYLAPSYRAGAKEHAYALQVLAEILGGGANSRLHHALVLDQQIAVAAGAFYSPSRYDLSSFGLFATPRPGKDVEEVGKAVEGVVAELLKDGVTADEVSRAETRLVTSAQYAQDSLESPAQIIGRALTTGNTLADLDAWPDRIKAVSVEQVMAAAHAVIDGKPAVTGLLLPADAAAAARFPAQPDVPLPSGDIR
ncbi:MAG TPA: pitrilysin family protein [Aliidongia sp.]|nr:pitrilysin family protein [Aliidongia sp.]